MRQLAAEQLDLMYANLGNLEQKFWKFDREHPEVYRKIVFLARGLLRQGFQSYSIDAIFHRIRWHMTVKRNRKEDGFKLNDHHTSFYARLVMSREPDLAHFFETRSQRSKK